jgi:hypothetical protein
MDMSRINYAVPIYIIILGLSWLMNVCHVVPKINWVAIIGVSAIGVLAMYVFRLSKVTVVGGSLLIASALCSLLEQTQILSKSGEAPLIIIILGCLLLIVQVKKLPTWRS